MYSASAQSTVRVLVMSARPRRIRERPAGMNSQPERCRGLATPAGGCICTQCTPSHRAGPWQITGNPMPGSPPLAPPLHEQAWAHHPPTTNVPPFGKKEQASLSEHLPHADTVCTESGTFLIGHLPQNGADCAHSPDEETEAQKRKLIHA